MYDMCRYGFALKITNFSLWCAVSSSHSLSMVVIIDLRHSHRISLKYSNHADIGIFYKHDHGQRDLPFVSDMVRHLESDDMPKVVASFIHFSAVRVLFSALSLRNDSDPITADSYCSKADRKWRVGHQIRRANIKFDFSSTRNRSIFLGARVICAIWPRYGSIFNAFCMAIVIRYFVKIQLCPQQLRSSIIIID